MSKKPLTNTLLIADPSLSNGIFDRTVIHLAEHSADGGAVGFIINKPTEKTVGEILVGDDFVNLVNIPIFFGGPVNTDEIIFSAYWWDEEGVFRYRLRISAKEAADMKHKAGCLLLAHVGHSAWSPGQLESELAEDAWVNCPVSSDTISIPSESLWRDLLAKVSPYHRLLSMTPSNLRNN